MFPLKFPYRILWEYGDAGATVMDPFCGRGTTLYAARLLSMPAYGIDSNPVGVAITRAKLAETTPARIITAARHILTTEAAPETPEGEFWRWAYAPSVLRGLC
jgi:DNA modification methylase